MRFAPPLAAACLVLAPAMAMAQDSTRTSDMTRSQPQQSPYVTFGAGLLQLRDNDGDVGGTSTRIDYERGYAFQIGVGRHLGDGFRMELEGGYGRAEPDTLRIGANTAVLDGSVNLWSAYLGGYYDFVLGPVQPYLGGGAGLVYVDATQRTATLGGVTATTNNSDDLNFSAFGEAGVNFAVGERFTIAPAIRYTWIDSSRNGFQDDQAWMFRLAARTAF